MADINECRLQLLMTRSLCRMRPEDVVRAAIRGGVDLLQIREKGARTEELMRRAEPLLEVAAECGVPVLINDDVAAVERLRQRNSAKRAGHDTPTDRGSEAVASNIRGVHVGQGDMSVDEVRRHLGPEAWVGLSTHHALEIRQANELPVTHVGLGCCFATSTKDETRRLAPAGIRAALDVARKPVFAIGGITAENVQRLIDLGVERVAVSSCILTSDDPEAVASRLARFVSI